MAADNPTGEERAVPLDLPPEQKTILRGTLTSCLEGVSGDLKTPDRVPDPDKARREADAYTRLLAALDQGRIVVPDDAAREAVEAMVLSVEEDTDYAEIIAEHDALFGLLSLLGGVVAKER